MGAAIAILLALLASGDYTPHPAATQLTRLEVAHVAYAVSGDIEWAVEAVDVAECESGDAAAGLWADTSAVGDGGRSVGAWQVQPRWWGAVPDGPYGQARQAYAIWLDHGWSPWSCAGSTPRY